MTVRNRIQPGDGDPRHGTTNGYRNHRCRCRPCTDAILAEQQGRRQVCTDLLTTLCWCEATYVHVSAEMVRAGQTLACRSSSCRPAALTPR